MSSTLDQTTYNLNRSIVTQGDTSTPTVVEVSVTECTGSVKKVFSKPLSITAQICNDGTWDESTNATIGVTTGWSIESDDNGTTGDKNLTFVPPVGAKATGVLTFASDLSVDSDTFTINGREYYMSSGRTTVPTGSVAVDISADGTKSQGKLTVIDAPTAGDTMTIGSTVYTFRAAQAVAGDIGVGAAAVSAISTITPVGGSVAQIETFTARADASDDLNQKYIQLSDEDGTVAVWIDVDDSGSAAPAHGLDRAIEVTGVVTDDTAAAVGTAVAAAIDGDSKFSASSAAGVVTVTHATAGAVGDGVDGDATFTAFTVTTNGTTNAWDQQYFVLQDTAGPVVFWMDVDNSGSTISAAATTAATGGRSVEITTVLGSSTNALAAALIDTAINADAQFSSSETGGVITVTNAEDGDFGAAADGDTTFTIAETTPGVDTTGQANIVAAINGTDDYNDANDEVTIAAFVDNDAILTSRYTGVIGDTIVTTETFTAAASVFDGATLGTETAGANSTDEENATAAALAITNDTSAAVTAVAAAAAVTITANNFGTYANSYGTTEVGPGASWGGALMTGGAFNGTGKLRISVTDGTAETVTLRFGPALIEAVPCCDYANKSLQITHAAP